MRRLIWSAATCRRFLDQDDTSCTKALTSQRTPNQLLRAFQSRAAAEFQAAIKDLLEQPSLLLGRKDFAIAIR